MKAVNLQVGTEMSIDSTQLTNWKNINNSGLKNIKKWGIKNLNEKYMNKNAHEEVKEYLESVKSSAKVMDNIEMMHRVDRALAAFDADVEDEIFNDDFKEKIL